MSRQDDVKWPMMSDSTHTKKYTLCSSIYIHNVLLLIFNVIHISGQIYDIGSLIYSQFFISTGPSSHAELNKVK